MNPISRDRRAVLATLVASGIALWFWFGSRYPSLDAKASMGGDIELDAIGFSSVWIVPADASVVLRILATTVNWLATNRQGMTFAIIFGAAMLVLGAVWLSRLRTAQRSGLAATGFGVALGAPMGVCVNCAAPIAQGLHTAGMRLETTLAALLSSPTLNVVVLSMLVSLLPWYMAATRIALTLLFIVVGVPLMTRWLFRGVAGAAPATSVPSPVLPPAVAAGAGDPEIGRSWRRSVVWFVRAYASSFWYLARTTVPLMFAAGLLGGVVATVMPWDAVAHGLPSNGRFAMLAAMAGLAVVGTFLPVPIAFDVLLPVVLLAAGLPVKYAMVLLFTLGLFSVYSGAIVWRGIAPRVAVTVFGGVAITGVVAGVVAHEASEWDASQQRALIYTALRQSPPQAPPPPLTQAAGEAPDALRQRLDARALALAPAPGGVADVTVEAVPFARREGADTVGFERLDGAALGLDDSWTYSALKHAPPFVWRRAIAAGDVHGDGWPDLLIAEDIAEDAAPDHGGVALYANLGGERFVRQRLDLPGLAEHPVMTLALVDLDNDGSLDLFATTWGGGTWVAYNVDGDFPAGRAVRLPDTGGVSAAAAAIDDLDLDGDLDIALGHWTVGFLRGAETPVARSRNAWLRQSPDGFEVLPLPGPAGETLSMLVTDFDGDERPDLIVGNDFAVPDTWLRGDGSGGLTAVDRQQGLVPHTTHFTMSVDAADLDNDLREEIFFANIARGTGEGFAAAMPDASETCDTESERDRARCRGEATRHAAVAQSMQRRDVRRCLALERADDRRGCVLANVLFRASIGRTRGECDAIPPDATFWRGMCAEMFGEAATTDPDAAAKAILQIRRRNVLLRSTADGRYEDIAEAAGVHVTGWSWNARFADLDHDGWQDLYVANGYFLFEPRPSNVFLRNTGGLRFENRTRDFGLVDHRATSAYVYVDFDGDGDLDVVSAPVNGPVRVFRNRLGGPDRHAIIVELRDDRGNRMGIGSRVVARAGDAAFMRAIRASGGFQSGEPARAHFGLGARTSVDELEVRWSTGEVTRLSGPFRSGRRYRLHRRARAAAR